MEHHFGTRERGPWTDEIRVFRQPLDLAWVDNRNPCHHQLQTGLSHLPPLPPNGLGSSSLTGLHAVPDTMHIITIDESASSHVPVSEPIWVGGHAHVQWCHPPEAPMSRVWFHEYTNPETRSRSSRSRRGYSERYYHSPSSSMTGTNNNDYRYPAVEDSPPRQSYPPTPHRSPRQWQSEQGSDMQMVGYRPDDAHDSRMSSSRHRENPYHHHEEQDTISSTNILGSPNRSTSTHTGSRRSLLASQDTGFSSSEYSPASMYPDSGRSSGYYVESYDDRGRPCGSYRDYDGYEGDSDGMSDGIASDVGVYDSSSSDRGDFEDDGDSYESYSDGGYSSDGYPASTSEPDH